MIDTKLIEIIKSLKEERKSIFKNKIEACEIPKEISIKIYNKLIDNKEFFIEKAYKEKNLETSLHISKYDKVKQNFKESLNNIIIINEIINEEYHYEDFKVLEEDIKLLSKSLKNYHRYIKFNQYNFNKEYQINDLESIKVIDSAYKKLSYLLTYLIYTAKKEIPKNFDYNTIIESYQFIESALSLSTIKRLTKLNNRIIEYNRQKEIENSIENLKISLKEKSVEFKNPVEEYLEARQMNRHFIIHAGQTNTGKTYQAIQDLKLCPKGVYLAPLRLLAIEIQDELNESGVVCDLLTGEEEIIKKFATHVSSTVEKINLNENYDICVIDECQMIGDSRRGGAWTKAIMGVKANKIHLCTAPSAVEILKKLITLCGDTYEVVEHKRKTSLEIDKEKFISIGDAKPGDALVVFTKKDVISVASALENNGFKCSIIYGALPYDTRKKQFKLFLDKKTDIVVTTDAISMGVNLPIKRVVFLNLYKFDGISTRALKSEEVKQIAGRAGRQGMYNIGYVNSIENINFVRNKLNTPYKDLEKVYLPVPESITKVEQDIEATLRAWKDVDPGEGFEKCSIDRQLFLIKAMRSINDLEYERLDRIHVYKLCNMYFEDGDKSVLNLWKDYISEYFINLYDNINPPNKDNFEQSLRGLESYYKSIELYYSFCNTFYIPYDREWIRTEKMIVSEEINEYLLKNIKSHAKTCKICKKNLAWNSTKDICNKCLLEKSMKYYGKNIKIR